MSVLCIFVSLPYFAPKRGNPVKSLGEGTLTTAQWRSFSTGRNRTIFSPTSTHRLQGLLTFCWLFPALCWFSFLPSACVFLAPTARRHLNFLIRSCKLGEGNTTTFRGLVEEQLEVFMGCVQAWLQELPSKHLHLLHHISPDLCVRMHYQILSRDFKKYILLAFFFFFFNSLTCKCTNSVWRVWTFYRILEPAMEKNVR